ncbi:MAG: NAD(P)/FAD-dependent oxidoreductase, partial [Clostridia bacterium]|nr:NAD(P)/FAD-dependent oxidoreductase [Clostridia bacterium]
YYNTSTIDKIVKNFDMKKEMESLGLITKVKSGRIYPFSEQSNNVLNVFLSNMQRYSVKVITNCTAKQIKITNNVCVITSKGEVNCKKVCLATGSNASFGANSLFLYENLGHTVCKTTPSLVPLLAKKQEQIKGLSGVRQEANVRLFDKDKLIATEFGEVQFRKDGISGIVILNISAKMCHNNMSSGTCYLDFMPDFTKEQVGDLLENNITAEFGLLNKNLMQNAIKLGVDGIKNYRIDVVKSEDNKLAQVMHGGLNIDEFDLNTMASKINNNLYAIGEALNVDGLCGGYNLHFALASAYNLAKEF